MMKSEKYPLVTNGNRLAAWQEIRYIGVRAFCSFYLSKISKLRR